MLLAVCAHTPVWARTDLHTDFLKTPTDLSPAESDIVKTDRAIFLELINLARFNIKFHQTCNKQWVWRSWIYPIMQEAGTGGSFANTIIDLNQRARGLDNLDKISVSAQKKGLSSAIVGNAISGTASASELTQNAIVAHLATRQGYSPRDSVAFVKSRLTSIDKLMAERQRLIGTIQTDSTVYALNLEGRLLRQIRAQLLLEFERWSASSREQMWRENTFYTIDATQNFVSVASNILSLKGYTLATLRGNSAITQLVANSMAATNPFIRTSVGWCVRKYERRRLAKEFPDKRPRTTKDILAGWQDLHAQLPGVEPSSVDALHTREISFLSENSALAEAVIFKEQLQMEKLRRVAAQQTLSGPLIGTFSVARSLLATIGYYGYRSEPVVNNRLAFAGRISQATGQTYSLIITPTTRIRQSLYQKKLAKKGELPEQILEKRMQRLNQMERDIKASQDSAAPIDK